MRNVRCLAAALGALTLLSPLLFAQEKSASESRKPASTLKLQVTIAEQEGDKKLANLPYTFLLRAGEDRHFAPWTKVRMGSRFPVYMGKEGGMQYIDVGTNIDAQGVTADEGRFDIALNLERSWVEGDVLVPTEKSAAATAGANSGQFKEPIIRQFKTELNLSMRDGQTIQSTQATDPLSGRVLTLTITMTVVK